MNLVLFDDPAVRTNLFPFTITRPVAAIRVGILTIREKWEKRLEQVGCFLTEPYLQKKFPLRDGDDNLLINGAVCPDDGLVAAVLKLKTGEALALGDLVIASRQTQTSLTGISGHKIEYTSPITLIDKPWKIFLQNAHEIRVDFPLVTRGRSSAGIGDRHTVVYGENNLFVEEGVTARAAIINAERGPVYLGRNTILHEGVMIRGTFALCEGSEVNMGGKIRGDTTIGPFCKVGGEVAASVIFGYSNKSHDGYLGCSVIGEWCNIGADSNTSNLKNNYEPIKLWDHRQETFLDTGLQFLGLMMGDHSKCGINSMFNTGTVVDVNSNVFGEGFLRNYIPSFTWGGGHKLSTYKLDKALEVASRVMERRDIVMSEGDRELLTAVFERTSAQRHWDH